MNVLSLTRISLPEWEVFRGVTKKGKILLSVRRRICTALKCCGKWLVACGLYLFHWCRGVQRYFYREDLYITRTHTHTRTHTRTHAHTHTHTDKHTHTHTHTHTSYLRIGMTLLHSVAEEVAESRVCSLRTGSSSMQYNQ